MLAFRPSIGSAATIGSEYDLTTPSGTLFGTLRLPDGVERPPVAFIVAGSGPTDRNGNSALLTLDTYRKLADVLAASGVASVRYDKRGIAASRAAMTSEADLRFDMLVDDAAAWIAKLRDDGPFSRVVLVGHSEGSLIGMIVASRIAVDAFVSLEGTGFPAYVVLADQLHPSLSAYPDLEAKARDISASLVAGKTVPSAEIPPALAPIFRASVQPYLISWFTYDPRIEIVKVDGRVTIVQGTHDVQIPVADGRALAAARPNATFVLVDGMTHVLSDDPGSTLAEQTTGAYADAARPLDATMIRAVVAASTAGPSVRGGEGGAHGSPPHR